MTAICLGCMKRMSGEKKFCPYCGFNYRQYMEKRNENSLPPGTVLNHRYLLGKVLGSGGFGITYLGLDRNLDRKVAIKEYFPTANASRTGTLPGEHSITVRAGGNEEAFSKGLENFLAEAKTLAGLTKAERKAVVSVIDFFNANGTGYMVMEYLSGPTLKSIIKNRKDIMTEDEVCTMISPVLDSLSMIHAQDLIHRDISPDNLMLDDSGNLVLIDFGASRSLEGDKSLTVVLKPGFAPFEQYTRDGAQGPWTDVYALCATIYYMVTGAVPPSSTDRAMAISSRPDPLKKLRDLNMPVSREFSDAIYKGMALSIEDRFQNVTDLKKALEQALHRGKRPDAGPFDSDMRRGRNYQFDQDKTKDYSGDNRDRMGKDPYQGRIALYSIIGVICMAIILVSVLWLTTRGGSDPGENSATTSPQTMVAGDDKQDKQEDSKSSSADYTADPKAVTESSDSEESENKDAVSADLTVMADGTQPSYLTGKYAEEHVIQIYTEADENSEKVPYGEHTCLPESVFVAVLDTQGAFSKIWYGGITGWVKSRYLIHFSDEDYYMWEKGHGYTAYVFVNHIEGHVEASESSSVMSVNSLEYGKEVKVQEVKNGFARVTVEGKTCWLDMHFLRTYAKKNKKWKVDTAQGSDSGETINLRQKASEDDDSKILLKIENGEEIKITKFKDGWGKTRYEGKDGWVMLKHCTPIAD